MLDLYIHVLIIVSLDLRSVRTCSDSCVFDVRFVCVHVLILVSLDVRSVRTCSDYYVFGS